MYLWPTVVRPRNGAGTLARGAVVVFAVMTFLPVLLVRMPSVWVELVGSRLLVRLAVLALIAGIVAWVRSGLYGLLPTAARLSRRHLRVPRGIGRITIPIDDIVSLLIDRRPAPVHQVLQVQLRSGSVWDVCPMHWPGAGRLYKRLRKRVSG